MARVVIEVPEEIAALVERDPLLRIALVEAVKKGVTEYLLTVMALDRLTEDSRLDEREALEIGRLIKRSVREKWDAESGG
jgi:hypothetical protein